MIGAIVRTPDGKQLGTVQWIILEASATVGLLFNYNGKIVGLRTGSPNITIDGRSVTLRTENANAILTVLEAYRLAGPGGTEEVPKRAEGAARNCMGKDQVACKAIEACNWIGDVLDAKTGTIKTRGYCRRRPSPFE
jgi:hypothetical protein